MSKSLFVTNLHVRWRDKGAADVLGVTKDENPQRIRALSCTTRRQMFQSTHLYVNWTSLAVMPSLNCSQNDLSGGWKRFELGTKLRDIWRGRNSYIHKRCVTLNGGRNNFSRIYEMFREGQICKIIPSQNVLPDITKEGWSGSFLSLTILASTLSCNVPQSRQDLMTKTRWKTVFIHRWTWDNPLRVTHASIAVLDTRVRSVFQK